MSRSRRGDPFAELYGDLSDRLRSDGWKPDVDVCETEGEVVVSACVSGVRSEDLRVSVDASVLRIAGVRRSPERGGVKRLHQMEIVAGPFERRVSIPVAFQHDRVSAHLADGVLTVTLPKRAAVRLEIESES